MDHDLRRLERAAHEDPGDVRAAALLEAALLRAGLPEAVRDRYRFKFLCPLAWEDLQPTRDRARRSCERCQRQVVLVQDADAFTAAARAGECVSVPLVVVEEAIGRLVADPRVHSAEQSGRPCVVQRAALKMDEVPVASYPSAWLLTPRMALRGGEVAQALHERLEHCLLDRPGGVVLDLSGVAEVEDTVLATLVRACDLARNHGRRVVLQGARPQVRRVIQTLGLEPFFDLADDLDAAVAQLKRPFERRELGPTMLLGRPASPRDRR